MKLQLKVLKRPESFAAGAPPQTPLRAYDARQTTYSWLGGTLPSLGTPFTSRPFGGSISVPKLECAH